MLIKEEKMETLPASQSRKEENMTTFRLAWQSRSPFWEEDRHKYLEIARILLQHNADANAPCGDGNTNLVLAVRLGFPVLLSELVARGARDQLKQTTWEPLLCIEQYMKKI